MKSILKAFAILLLLGAGLSAQIADKINKAEPVRIMGTQLLHLKSKIVDQEYDLYINLPRNYSDTDKSFPVLYHIDAQWDFPLVQSIYGQQYYDGFIPEIVIVGITWGGKDPDYDALRRRDLTPSFVQREQPSGNASKFIECIRKEIIPFVESKFRVNNDRALMGSSFGGLFTLYALFTETDLFKRYILTSPSLQWDNGILCKIEKSYSENNSALPVKLYMGIGGYEDAAPLKNFTGILEGRGYRNFEIESGTIEGGGHSGSKAEGYTRGLQFVYRKNSVELTGSVLEPLTGVYEVYPGFQIKMVLENDMLYALSPGNNKIRLNAETENDFYVNGQFLVIHFVRDESGKVSGFNLERFEGKQFVRKTDN